MAVTKIVTCCYCGSQAALVLGGAVRHELRCASCAAPLSRLKMLPIRADQARPTPSSPSRPAAFVPGADALARSLQKGRKSRKPKPVSRKIWGGVWDLIEDALD